MSEPITVDLGAVTAYADAVEQGYTGTREEFGELLANFAKRADEVKQDKEEVKQAKEEVFSKAESFDKHVEDEKNRVTEEFNSNAEQVLNTNKQELGTVKDNALEEIVQTKEESVTEVTNTKNSGVKEITDLTNTNKSILENTGTNQKNLIESEGTKQIQAVENKGTATLATIPEDYTALNTSVNDLKDLMHMKAPAIVEEATSSTEIIVNDSADGMRLQKLNVYGKSWQVSTTGKNLLNADEYYSEFKQSDGTYKGTTTAVHNILIKATSDMIGKTYTISAEITVPAEVTYCVIQCMVNASSNFSNQVRSGNSGKMIVKFTPTSVDDYFCITYGSGGGGLIMFYNLQLELGSVATSYELYTGGKPSPSPDYPKEIESVGRVLSTGKNLFNFSKLNADYGLNTNDKTIVIPAKINNVGYYNSLKELCSDIKAGDTYVLSAKTSNPEALRTIHLVNTNVDFNFGKAFIPTEEQINDKISFYNNADTEKENVISEIQLEEGNIATSYEPYTGGVPALYQKNIEVKLVGKNYVNTNKLKELYTYENGSYYGQANPQYANASKIFLYNELKSGKNYKFSATLRSDEEGVSPMLFIKYTDGTSDNTTGGPIATWKYHEIISNANKIVSECYINYSNGGNIYIKDDISIVEYPTQSLPIVTPTGLPAIPVPSDTSGIIYTDADGQAWIADEIDFERGKYIQRVWQAEFDGSEDENWTFEYKTKTFYADNVLPVSMNYRIGFSNKYIANNGKFDVIGIQFGRNNKHMCVVNDSIFDELLSDYGLSNWKAHLSANPLKVMTYLDTPIETDLSEELIAAYKQIHTNKPTTIISNDADVWMGASYAADTKLYIDNKVQEIASAVIASASEAE